MKIHRAHPPTKTLRCRLGYHPQANVWFVVTEALFNHVAAFHFEAIEAHPGVLEHSDNKETLTALARLTHATAKNPNPMRPLAEGVPGNIPAKSLETIPSEQSYLWAGRERMPARVCGQASSMVALSTSR
jgi:hypothetical protein